MAFAGVLIPSYDKHTSTIPEESENFHRFHLARISVNCQMYREVSSICHRESLFVHVVAGIEPQGRWQPFEDACKCGWRSELQVGLRI